MLSITLRHFPCPQLQESPQFLMIEISINKTGGDLIIADDSSRYLIWEPDPFVNQFKYPSRYNDSTFTLSPYQVSIRRGRILLLANQILIILGLHPEIGTNLMVEIFTGNPYWSLRKMETDHCPKMISVFIFARQCQICILISICSLLFISKVWRPVCRCQPSTGMPRSLLSHQWTTIRTV